MPLMGENVTVDGAGIMRGVESDISDFCKAELDVLQ